MNRLIKTTEEINMIRKGGHILGQILEDLVALVRPGVETKTLEDTALALIQRAGGRPAFKGYKPDKNSKPFPSALCISVNEEIVHGPAFPSRELQEGQIVTLDIGMEYPYIKGKKGYYTDMATTVGVGNISIDARKLLAGTKESLAAGINFVKPGVTLNELGKTIETVLKKYNLGVIRDLVGHGVGLDVHEPPQVPNYSFKKNEFPDMQLKPGMVIAIEPMATLGGWQIEPAADGFTYITADKSLAAHFEHTVLVTEEGSEVLTYTE